MPHNKKSRSAAPPSIGAQAVSDMLTKAGNAASAAALESAAADLDAGNTADLEEKVMGYRPRPVGSFPQDVVDGFRIATEEEGTFAMLITYNPETRRIGMGHNAPTDADAMGLILVRIVEQFALKLAAAEAVANTFTTNMNDALETQREMAEQNRVETEKGNDPASKLILPGQGLAIPGKGGIVLPN